jgi:hypothetical protein
MPRAFPGSLQNFFNVMPQHRRSIIKDGISSFLLTIFTRKNNFNLQTRRAILRAVITHGETYPLFLSTIPAFFQQSCNDMKIITRMI